jgi:hypothetical protein
MIAGLYNRLEKLPEKKSCGCEFVRLCNEMVGISAVFNAWFNT